MTDLIFPAASSARLLVVDDEPANVRVLTHALRLAGYEDVHATTDPREAMTMVAALEPDLVLLDLLMPHMDGFEVMRQLALLVPSGVHLPVLVLTADVTPATRRQAFEFGATDFLTKPFDIIEVALRVRNLLRVRFLARGLEGQVRERTRDLEAARVELVERLATAAEYRDDDTGQHTRRVGLLAARMAAALGWPADEVDALRQAAPLHDVGKIGVLDSILLKPGPLTPDEMAVMRTHTTIGGRILSGARFPVLRMAEAVALSHHERWDGSGYPAGLAGEAIPRAGRVVAVADVYDALTHTRPYKAAWTPADAVEEIRRQAGRQFDPAVVSAFLSCRAIDALGPDATGGGVEDAAALAPPPPRQTAECLL